MPFKTMLMHAARDEALDARLKMAAGVAELHQASFIALGAAAPWPYVDASDFGDDAARELVERTREDVAVTKAAVLPYAGLFSHGFEWRERVEPPGAAVARMAHAADLVIAQRIGLLEDLSFHADPGAVLMEAGTPVLLLPTEEKPLLARTVVLGWKNSREARRALAMALPALIQADEVIVAAVCPERRAAEVEAELASVCARLRRNGVNAQSRFAVAAHDATERLTEIADAAGADLIVCGGYGHSRLREWVLGGMTRDLIADGSRYVMLCH